MKIAYITMQFPVYTETFAINDIKALQQLNKNVFIFTLKGKNRLYKKLLVENNLEKVQIDTFSKKKFISNLLKGLKTKWTLTTYILSFKKTLSFKELFFSILLINRSVEIFFQIKKQNFDVVHLFWGHYPSLTGYLIRKYINVRLTTFLGAYDLESYYKPGIDLARKVDIVFTHAKKNIQILEALDICRNKIKCIHRGVDTAKFIDFNGSYKNTNQIITAGKLVKEKKFDKVLHVFSRVQNKIMDVKLIIAGDGPQKKSLIRLAKKIKINNKVDFLGRITQDQLIKEMLNSNVFIFLTEKKSERLPNVVKEALASGCKCYVSNSIGIDELIETEENGYIFMNEDIQEMADVIISELTGKSKIKLTTAEIQKRLLDEFDVKEKMAQYLFEWEKIHLNQSKS